MAGPFLTAEWRMLAILNFEIDPAVLRPFVPAGTELDAWNGKTYVSLVGFMFLRTRVLGLKIPFHSDFEEVNLRFYVRRLGPEGWRRGVVFIKEIVPRAAIAWVARSFYNENYVALPMSHQWSARDDGGRSVHYKWGSADRIEVQVNSEWAEAKPGSDEEFITEHYWGYARQRDGGTMEYQVEHPRWRVGTTTQTFFECDVERHYGPAFARPLHARPASAFLADGSPVTVHRGVRLVLD